MAKDTKVTVIGHLARDVYHLMNDDKEEVVETLGGIFYSLAALSFSLAPEDKIFPVFGIHEDEYDKIIELLQHLGNVDPKGVYRTKEKTNEVHFFSNPAGGRTECSKHIASPIPFSKIKPFLDVDGVLINMASGFDILLETLDTIRMNVREDGIPIHFDFHSLTLGVDDEQTRYRRPLSDWRRWCFMLHSIQLSEPEAAGLTAERYDEAMLINQLMPLMVSGLVITRGEGGATLIRQEHKKLFRHDIPGIGVSAVVDTVGCGDVFGAAFFAEFLKSKDLVKAAEAGNKAASFKSTFRGPDGLESLRQQPASTPPATRAEG
ncbi:MAG: carbohydrate kinase family protein [Ignavibacteriales bacterium]|nr:carbohydrate kinase family protein [Ignavibacteriales bacterium]